MMVAEVMTCTLTVCEGHVGATQAGTHFTYVTQAERDAKSSN